jgi:hypothetical protein
MPPALLAEYDRFLDENDWDIYYWATQDEQQPRGEGQGQGQASGASGAGGSSGAAPADPAAQQQSPRPGEWAQTVGTFRPAYRPVPARWRDSEVLRLLRAHVESRRGGGRGGMGFMPPLEEYKI